MTIRSLRIGGPQALLALCIGIGSGILANRAGLPLPWMLGPMIGNTVAAMVRLPVAAPIVLRPLVIPVIGVMLGSAINREVLAQAISWWPSMLLLVPFLVFAGTASYQFYRRVGGFDPVTAFFSAMPGGLNDMVILGAAAGADERRVALAHAVRILIVIVFVVLFFGLVLGVASDQQSRPWVGVGALGPGDMIWLVAAGLAGIPLGRVLRLPAAPMLGPMLLSGLAHVAGVVEVPPPTLLVIAAQIVLGTVIGCRFAGSALRDIGRDLMLGIGSSVLMILVAVGFAELLARLNGIDARQAFLAYSPGGLTEMSLLALAMGQEIAYVSLSHVARITLVIFGAPLVFRLLGIRPG